MGGRFFGAAGMPLEEFLRDRQRWEANVVLPGDWKSDPVSEGTASVMAQPGAVFGVAADSARVVRKKEGAVTEVTVVFSTKGSRLDQSKLLARLRANVASFLGTKPAPVAAGGKAEFTGKNLAIALEPARGGVTARIAQAPATATAATSR